MKPLPTSASPIPFRSILLLCASITLCPVAFSAPQDEKAIERARLDLFQDKVQLLKTTYFNKLELDPLPPQVGAFEPQQGTELQLDTHKWALNVIRPTSLASATQVLENLEGLQPRNGEVLTVYGNDDGSGMALSYVALEDTSITEAHKGMIKELDEALSVRRDKVASLAESIYRLGLWSAIIAAISTIMATFLAATPKKPLVLTLGAAALTASISVMAFVITQRTELRETTQTHVKQVRDLKERYKADRAKVATNATLFFELIDDVRSQLRELE